jgi:hypothetical protein
MECTGHFLNNKCFFLPSNDSALVALLNSTCLWFQLRSLARIKRGNYIEAEAQYVEKLHLPNFAKDQRNKLAKHADASAIAAIRHFEIQSAVRHRILDLAPPERAKLSRKLEEWWTLDFDAFRDEIKRAFRTEIPVKERGEWEDYLRKHATQVRKLDGEIENAEREIDAIVYRLFDLTPDEVKLLEASIEGQY